MKRLLPSLQFLLLAVVTATLANGATTASWRFTGAPGLPPDDATLQAQGPNRLQGQLCAPGSSVLLVEQVAHPFLYDPLAQESVPTVTSLDFRSSSNQPRHIAVPVGDIDGSFTLEVIARNGEVLPSPHGRPLTLLNLLSHDAVHSVQLTVFGAHGYHWWGGALQQGGQTRQMARERYHGISHVRSSIWRHLALVYDASQATLTTYLDFFPQQTLALESPLNLPDATLHIGDDPGNQTDRRFVGQISDVRLTPQALDPWDFLRATPYNLHNVSFEPHPGLLPPGSGCLDLRLHYGAVGDGRHDDTHAFRRAFAELQDRVPVEYHTLVVPEGTYLISEPIGWTRFLVVQGAGVDKTILRAPDNAPAFSDPTRPDAILYVGWDTWRQRADGQGSAGNAIGNYLFDLTIDSGNENPGAVALSFHSNNHGSIENVSIRSGDGAGHRGLDFSMNWPGPTLVKNVQVNGFDTGIYTRASEYSLVFENVQLINQRQIALLNEGNVLSIRKLSSRNGVPVIRTGGWGMVTLIDSHFEGEPRVSAPAISNHDNGALYVRNVRIRGYSHAIQSNDSFLPEGWIQEFLAGRPQSLFSAPESTLNLPIQDAPSIPLADASVRWANVLDFTNEPDPDDWAPVIQAAVNSGADGLYFPANAGNGYRVRSTIEIPPQLRYVLGMRTGIGRHDDLDGPTVRVSKPAKHPVIFERFGVGGLPTSPGRDPEHPAFEHTADRVVVFRHHAPFYQAREGAGDLFVEAGEGYWRFARGQKVWGRQMNPESHHVSEVINEGADVWILGLKTEYATTMVVNRNQGRLELLGGFLYPVTEVPQDLPMVINENASMSMIFSTTAYQHDHRIYFRDTQNRQTRELLNRDIDSKGPRRHVHLFTSKPPPP
jgi:hypothetical protein